MFWIFDSCHWIFSHHFTNTQFSLQGNKHSKNNRVFSLWFIFVIVLIKHGSNICFFLSQCWSQANNGTQKMWKEHCNHRQWGEGHRLEGTSPGHCDGGEGAGLLRTMRRQESLGSLLQGQALKRKQRNWPWDRSSETETGTVKLRRAWVWRNWEFLAGRDPKKGRTWSWGFEWTGHRKAASSSLHSSSRSTRWLCFPPLVPSPTIPARDAPLRTVTKQAIRSSLRWWQEPRAQESTADTPEKSQARTGVWEVN